MKVRVVTRPAQAAGFELTGLPVTRADDAEAAIETVRRFASEEDVGIVLVEETLYRALPPDVLRRFDRDAVPMIAPVPAARWNERSEAEAYVLEILRQAIGYRVRPR